jgi:hypothetical protein
LHDIKIDREQKKSLNQRNHLKLKMERRCPHLLIAEQRRAKSSNEEMMAEQRRDDGR